MKKLSAILLFSIYCLTATELGQLLKLPLLVEHFIEHSAANKNLSIAEFFAMHYASDAPKDNDYAKDKQLPFKDHNTSTNANWVAFAPVITAVQSDQPFEVEQNLFVPHQASFISSNSRSAVWQPPKSC